VFEDFIEQLLPLCGRWLEPKSVLVMDNASFHHTKRIERMCRDAGVKLMYLPPYSPDFNPIEEFFAELKAFIKRSWHNYEENPQQGFDAFLEWCINIVGGKKNSARGHFRHAGLKIEELKPRYMGDRIVLKSKVLIEQTSTVSYVLLIPYPYLSSDIRIVPRDNLLTHPHLFTFGLLPCLSLHDAMNIAIANKLP
jgi:hypothetical protein